MSPTFKTCFLIDDDMDDQEIFSLAIKDLGQEIRCFFANDSEDALDKLHHDKSFLPDYIFLDLNMPRIDGRKCLADIRKQTHLNDIPVIVYSTSSESRDINETSRLGAAGFITKPATIQELSKILEEVFSKYTR